MSALALCDLQVKQKPLVYPDLDLSEVKRLVKSYRQILYMVENRWDEISERDRTQLVRSVYDCVDAEPLMLQFTLNDEPRRKNLSLFEHVNQIVFSIKMTRYIHVASEANLLASRIINAVLANIEKEHHRHQQDIAEALSDQNLSTPASSTSANIFDEFFAEQDAASPK